MRQALKISLLTESLYFEHKDELIEKLKSLVIGASLVFVKGSHGMHMEEIIEAIKYFNI